MERIRQREDVRLIVLTSVADAIREDIPQEIYSNIIDCLEENVGDEEKGEIQNIDQGVNKGLEQEKPLDQGNQGVNKQENQGVKKQEVVNKGLEQGKKRTK
eukprot:TRINITY_DN20625_c0_g1_i2.p1 TRINITY_DN20625_c0_g1~~TRINITY_DN20625_c0_g1_i2.p1  ORF type:complete len:101 (+),score=19.50 TRINITY_DN20625_c0_g1_i2:173-475(+)